MFGLYIGYAAPDALNEVKPRLPQDVILFRETYGNSQEKRLRTAYDKEMAQFSERNNMPQDTWTQRVLIRMGKLASMNGRETLKDVVRGLGFPLK